MPTGGGGGSSFAALGTSDVVHTQGYRSGDGQIILGGITTTDTVGYELEVEGPAPPPAGSTTEAETTMMTPYSGTTSGSQGTRAATPGEIQMTDCHENPQSNTRSGWVANHLYYCKLDSLILTKTLTTCGTWGCKTRVTGTARWRQGTIGRGTPSGGRLVTFSTVLDNWFIDGDIGPTMLNVGIDCWSIVGLACDTSAPTTHSRTVADWASSVSAYAQFSSELAGAFGPDLLALAGFALFDSVPTKRVDLGGNEYRCDSAPYLPGSGGCIFRNVTEVFRLSRTDRRVTETAQHIEDAQFRPWLTVPFSPWKSVPGSVSSGRPLERNFYDFDLQRANRRAATATCSSINPTYAVFGQECDEYPFASTFQGAATGDDYSARPVTANDNSVAGGNLSAFYGGQRILHEDTFYVDIVP